MTSRLVCFALALSLAACASAPRGGTDAPLRVLVFNLHAGKDAAGEHNLARVAALVRESGADLVLLQEVDRGTERSGGEDQLSTLERLTGLRGAFGRTLDFQGGAYGIALLSRWPITADSLHPLVVRPPQERAGGSYEPRGALVASVAAPAGPLHLVVTHLDASAGDHFRLQEVAQVRALADGLSRDGDPVLVGGDFNATPESSVISRMTSAGWTDSWPGCGAGEGMTFPAREPIKRIDYLFLSPGVSCDSAAVLPSRASDHRPVLLVLNRSEKP